MVTTKRNSKPGIDSELKLLYQSRLYGIGKHGTKHTDECGNCYPHLSLSL